MSITLPRAESLCDLVEPGSVPEAEKPMHGLALPSQLALQIGARLPHRGQSDVKCDLEKDLGRELKDQSILRNSGCDRDVVAIVDHTLEDNDSRVAGVLECLGLRLTEGYEREVRAGDEHRAAIVRLEDQAVIQHPSEPQVLLDGIDEAGTRFLPDPCIGRSVTLSPLRTTSRASDGGSESLRNAYVPVLAALFLLQQVRKRGHCSSARSRPSCSRRYSLVPPATS